MLRLIRWCNKLGDITNEFWEKAIQFQGKFHGLEIIKWIIWAIFKYLKLLCQIQCYYSRVNYINYKKKFCMVSPAPVGQRCSIKKMLLKLTQNLQEISHEFCEIFKSTYFEEDLWMTASTSQILHSSKQHCRTRCQI